MGTGAATSYDIYDDFGGTQLDSEKWHALEIPLGPDATWTCAEPNAVTTVDNGTLEVRVAKFERAHDQVQILDNPKHLCVSRRTFAVPKDRPIMFAVDMAAETLGGDPHDYRDGFAAFNVLDMGKAMVWDHIATSHHLYAIHERLFVPGVVDPDRAFSWIVESPLAVAPTGPGQFHEYAITLDATTRTARWLVDGRPVFDVRELDDVPETIVIGFSLITLHPITNGASTSLRGQGMVGRWKNFRYQR